MLESIESQMTQFSACMRVYGARVLQGRFRLVGFMNMNLVKSVEILQLNHGESLEHFA